MYLWNKEPWRKVIAEVAAANPALAAVLAEIVDAREQVGDEVQVLVHGNLSHLDLMRRPENVETVTDAVRRNYPGAARIRVGLTLNPPDPPQR